MTMTTYTGVGTLSVQGIGEASRMFTHGQRVDLDAVLVPATGQTVGEAVARYRHLFTEDTPTRGQRQTAKPSTKAASVGATVSDGSTVPPLTIDEE